MKRKSLLLSDVDTVRVVCPRDRRGGEHEMNLGNQLGEFRCPICQNLILSPAIADAFMELKGYSMRLKKRGAKSG